MTLTELQRRKARQLFAVYDRNANGVLDRDDYERLGHRVAKEAGHSVDSPEHEQVTRFLLTKFERSKAVADFSRDGVIQPGEWEDFFEIVVGDERALSAMVDETLDIVFRCCDLDGNAVIDLEELEKLRRAFGLPTEDTEEVLAALDANGDGVLSVPEVRAAIEDYFQSDDEDAAGNRFFAP